MGGHTGWRKRVRSGLLAKEGGGGNIARHRPRFGRQGIIVVPKRGDSNPKRKALIRSKKTQNSSNFLFTEEEDSSGISVSFNSIIFLIVFLVLLSLFMFHSQFSPSRERWWIEA